MENIVQAIEAIEDMIYDVYTYIHIINIYMSMVVPFFRWFFNVFVASVWPSGDSKPNISVGGIFDCVFGVKPVTG